MHGFSAITSSVFTGAVENGDGITTAFDVQRKVTPHHSHTDNPDLLLGHYILLSGVVTATLSQLKCDDNVSLKPVGRIA